MIDRRLLGGLPSFSQMHFKSCSLVVLGAQHRYTVDPVKAKALETILILHMDHEQNASTSTVRTAGSSQANPFTCVSAGIGSLHGPAHGGANVAVMKMLLEIQKMGGTEKIPVILERAKDKNDPFRLMGFGHRVYKNYDPRAKIMRRVTAEVLERLEFEDPLLKIAMELEKAALADDYFVQRHLYPNIDFYSGITLCALGIPLEMYTVIFTIARVVGWCAQWREFAQESNSKITRPRQLYTGSVTRPFVPPDARKNDGSCHSGKLMCSRSIEQRVFASTRSMRLSE